MHSGFGGLSEEIRLAMDGLGEAVERATSCVAKAKKYQDKFLSTKAKTKCMLRGKFKLA